MSSSHIGNVPYYLMSTLHTLGIPPVHYHVHMYTVMQPKYIPISVTLQIILNVLVHDLYQVNIMSTLYWGTVQNALVVT